ADPPARAWRPMLRRRWHVYPDDAAGSTSAHRVLPVQVSSTSLINSIVVPSFEQYAMDQSNLLTSWWFRVCFCQTGATIEEEKATVSAVFRVRIERATVHERRAAGHRAAHCPGTRRGPRGCR